ncbi:hypothetical protein B296_00009000 [Ensete ventricosum]|uniref:Uncharacterized protein n=1 Tax=Ensete ventricosum TaxID=4639 RepID=A0A426Z6L1_ENSVE|nr:hypothetical protein B296_00009000 [Ensete ventricosum]
MAKALRNLNRAKPQSCGVGLLAVFILVSLSYVTMSKTNKMRISLATSQLPPLLKVNSTSMTSDKSDGHYGSSQGTKNPPISFFFSHGLTSSNC